MRRPLIALLLISALCAVENLPAPLRIAFFGGPETSDVSSQAVWTSVFIKQLLSSGQTAEAPLIIAENDFQKIENSILSLKPQAASFDLVLIWAGMDAASDGLEIRQIRNSAESTLLLCKRLVKKNALGLYTVLLPDPRTYESKMQTPAYTIRRVEAINDMLISVSSSLNLRFADIRGAMQTAERVQVPKARGLAPAVWHDAAGTAVFRQVFRPAP